MTASALSYRLGSLVLAGLSWKQLSSATAFLPSLVSWKNHEFLSARSSSLSWPLSANTSPYLSAEQLYFDIAVDGEAIGRLVFALSIPSNLPAHAQNLIDLSESRHYVGCEFDYGADYIQGESRYRWCHIMRGRHTKKTVSDPENQRNSKHSIFGGNYYGDAYEGQTVVLSVAIEGPGQGSARFSIVRIAESPQEWGERLLLSSGVIGELVDGMDTLQQMAQQRKGPPTVTGCGSLKTNDD